MPRKSILSPETHQECVDRIDKLTTDAQPAWGAMNVAQMLAHCAEVQEVFNGKPLENTPFIVKLFKGMIRSAVFNDKPYSKNTRTHPQYVIADQRQFEVERTRLLNALAKTAGLSENERRNLKHILFGSMTDEEIGWGTYKHLDHHLQQFGV